MKAFALVVITLTLLALPTRSIASETSDLRVAYIPPSTLDVPWPNVCILDAATLANACPLPTEDGVNSNVVAWSPDGTMVATQQELFKDGENVGSRIVVFAADGSHHLSNGRASPAVVTGNARVRGKPMWSNDSRRVAGVGEGGIVIANIAGGHLDTIELGDGQIFDAAWSPDSTQFAVGVIDPGGKSSIISVDARTGSHKVLRQFAGNESGPGAFNGVTWSADGRRIVFTYSLMVPLPAGGAEAHSQDWIVNADGSGARMLWDSANNGLVVEARLSADGKEVAVDTLSRGVLNVFIVRTDGLFPRQLTHSAAGAFRPRWWPLGDERLLYWDSDTGTMDMADFRYGSLTPLLPAMEFEWAPAPGPLPANAVTPTPSPTPTVTPTPPPISTPVGQPSPIPVDLHGPNVGSGASGSGGGGLTYAALGLLGAGVLIGGYALRRLVRAGRR
jgi:WD40 repeat protein